MIYDIILIAIVLLSVFIGIRKGAAKTLLSLVIIIIASVAAFLFSKPLSEATGIYPFIIAGILFVLSEVVLSIVTRPILKVFKLPFLRTADKIAGALIGLLRGVVIAFVIIFALCLVALVIPADTALIGSESIDDSLIFNFVYSGRLFSFCFSIT